MNMVLSLAVAQPAAAAGVSFTNRPAFGSHKVVAALHRTWPSNGSHGVSNRDTVILLRQADEAAMDGGCVGHG
jgi:hypothetical protein